MIRVFDRKENLEALLKYILSLLMSSARTSIPSLIIRDCSEVDELVLRISRTSSVGIAGISEEMAPFLSY